MNQTLFTSLLLILSFIFCQQALSQVSDLDTGFGNSGIVIQDGGSYLESANAVAIQADGKIVVVGHWLGQDEFETILLRFNEDGSIDTGFGTGGLVITDSTDAFGYIAFGIAIQPDGKILAAGQAIDPAGTRFMLLRFNTDGTLDDGFGTGGAALANAGGNMSSGFGVALQPDGKILVSGFSNDGLNDNLAIVRFNPDGSLDPSFDGDGIVLTNFGNNDSRGYTVHLTPDGKILVAGRMSNGSTTNITVVRYETDGSLDSSFNGNGMVTSQVATVSDVFLPIGAALQPDGKLLVTTNSFINNLNEGFILLRYTADGSLDSQFGDNGKTLTTIGSFDVGRAVAVQPDGYIVVAGYSSSNFNPQTANMVLLRYNTNGDLDTQFGAEGLGLIITDINSQADIATTMALQPDGKIVLAGHTAKGGLSDISVLRFLPFPSAAAEAQASLLGISFFPNPVLETGKLAYELSENTTLSARLYDSQGRLLMTLIDHETKAAGKYQESITCPQAMPPGNYFFIMETNKGQQWIRLVKIPGF
jgi:uncharacterized delta-60 repeat protein